MRHTQNCKKRLAIDSCTPFIAGAASFTVQLVTGTVVGESNNIAARRIGWRIAKHGGDLGFINGEGGETRRVLGQRLP